MALRLVDSHKLTYEQYERRVENLNMVMTIQECCAEFDLWPTDVQRAIDVGAIIARKADAPIGKRGGNWLIERRSANELWGHRTEKELASNE